MDSRPHLRLAKLSDIPAMTEVYFDASRSPAETRLSSSENHIRELQKGFADGQRTTVVALDPETQTRLLGYVTYYQRNADEVFVENIYTSKNTEKDKDLRVGKHLLAQVVAQADSIRASQIVLESLPGAVSFYSAVGFMMTNPHKNEMKLPLIHAQRFRS